jgi:tetratricopeptide (TPR) repeat protein
LPAALGESVHPRAAGELTLRRLERPVLVVVLLVLVVTAFGATARHGFSDVDDPKYVTDNTHVRQGLTWAGASWAFTAVHAANWHPLTWLSHMADVSLFGLDPAGHHAVGVAWHAVATVLLFLVLARATGRVVPAAAVAAILGGHPLRVESVAWIAERKDVLSLALAMAVLLAYDAYVKRPRAVRLALVVMLYACGLMAKPMLVTLPFVLLLLDYWPYGRMTRGRDLGPLLREKALLLALAAASAAVTVAAQSGGGAVESLGALSLPARLANAVLSVATYLGQTFWPTRLAFFYPHPGYVAPERLGVSGVAGAVLLLAAVTAAAIALRRSRPHVLVGWLWFLVTLLPVIGLVQVGQQAHADRYTYLPAVGVILAVVWSVDAALGGRGRLASAVAAAACVAVVLALWVAVRARVGVFADPREVNREALAHTDRNYVAHNNLAILLGREGRLDEAERHLEAALAIVPAYPQAHDNLGILLMKRGRVGEAIPHFEAALARSQDPEIRNNLGNALLASGRLDDALQRLDQAIRLRPDYALAHFNRAMALGRLGRAEEALRAFDQSIRYRPDLADAWANRGLLLATLGREDEAASDLRHALVLRPGWTEVERALARLPR